MSTFGPPRLAANSSARNGNVRTASASLAFTYLGRPQDATWSSTDLTALGTFEKHAAYGRRPSYLNSVTSKGTFSDSGAGPTAACVLNRQFQSRASLSPARFSYSSSDTFGRQRGSSRSQVVAERINVASHASPRKPTRACYERRGQAFSIPTKSSTNFVRVVAQRSNSGLYGNSANYDSVALTENLWKSGLRGS
eukprot:6196802-Pleurochrysis_carterae.AAC.1